MKTNKGSENKSGLKLKNKARFWTGIGLLSIEVLTMIIVVLTFVNWSFITMRVLGVIAIVLFNILIGILIWSGSSQKE